MESTSCITSLRLPNSSSSVKSVIITSYFPSAAYASRLYLWACG